MEFSFSFPLLSLFHRYFGRWCNSVLEEEDNKGLSLSLLQRAREGLIYTPHIYPTTLYCGEKKGCGYDGVFFDHLVGPLSLSLFLLCGSSNSSSSLLCRTTRLYIPVVVEWKYNTIYRVWGLSLSGCETLGHCAYKYLPPIFLETLTFPKFINYRRRHCHTATDFSINNYFFFPKL